MVNVPQTVNHTTLNTVTFKIMHYIYGLQYSEAIILIYLLLSTDSNVLIDGKLQRTIKCEDSMWLLEGGKYIVVNLDKTEERFWTAVLEGDAEIDKTKVDTTRDISDFDEQTQSDFHHVMYDHRQKLQGKPTSQEVVCTEYSLLIVM